MQSQKENKETVKEKVGKVAANVAGALVGFLEQASNGMDMMHTNKGDGKCLADRIKEKQEEFRKKLKEYNEKQNAKKASAVKNALNKRDGR